MDEPHPNSFDGDMYTLEYRSIHRIIDKAAIRLGEKKNSNKNLWIPIPLFPRFPTFPFPWMNFLA